MWILNSFWKINGNRSKGAEALAEIYPDHPAAEDDFNLNLGEESIFTEWKFHGNKINLLIISGNWKVAEIIRKIKII